MACAPAARSSDEEIKVNVTLCFSAVQAMLAAKAGAYFISPFIGHLDDKGEDGMDLIHDIRQVYDNFGFSARTCLPPRSAHPRACEAVRARRRRLAPRCRPKIFAQLYKHELTDAGVAAFLKDWASTGQSIL